MREIVSHTSLRGLAALGVAIFHLKVVLPDAISPDRFTLFFDRAYAFVDLFFILSGFVMAFVYQRFLEEAPDRAALGQFFRARFARIYPLHFATLIFAVLLVVLNARLIDDASALNGAFARDIVLNIFLLHAWGPHDPHTLNFPSWSISAEFAAYLCFPLFALLWRRRVNKAALFAILAVHYAILAATYSTLDLDGGWRLLRSIPAFLLGMLVFDARGVIERLSDRALSIAQLAAAALVIAVMAAGLNDFLLIPLFAALILLTSSDRGGLARALAFPAFRALGAWSYAIYMLHVPLTNFIGPFYRASAPTAWGLSGTALDIGYFVLGLAATVAISALVYRTFETPMRDWLKKGGLRPVAAGAVNA